MTTASPERRRYRKVYNYRRFIGEPTSLVPSETASAHVRRLIDLGWSAMALHQLCDGRISDTTLTALANREHPMIERATAAAAMSLPLTVAVPDGLDGQTMVPTLGARRRVEALLRCGWPHRVMHAQYAAETTHLTRGTHLHMIAARWREIDAMYVDLHLLPGPSTISIQRATRSGFVPVAEWDDIDDPDENPAVLPGSGKYARDELVAEWDHLRRAGVPLPDAAERLGVTAGAIEKALSRVRRAAA